MNSTKIKFEAKKVYHIWTHANGNENLFRADENYRYFMNRYLKHVHPVVETFAYCLMPNHLHLMVRVREDAVVLEYLREKKKDQTLQGFQTLGGFSNCISRQFGNLFNGYTQAYNNKFNRKGSLFVPNFRRKLINSEKYFARLMVYIHNNPVYHGFVDSSGDWLYSSYLAYILNKSTNVEIREGLDLFGGIEAFKDLHLKINQEKLHLIFGK